MFYFKFIKCVLIIIIYFIQIRLNNAEETGIIDLNADYLKHPFCYRLSWIGPTGSNNGSDFRNATCNDVLRGARGVPCRMPLVVTENPPDTNWFWDNFNTTPANVACRLVRGEVCAKFSYRFNGAVENITYMCTKASFGGSSASPTCYRERHNSTDREVEVCLCHSRAGQYPCNLAQKIFTTHFFVFILINIFILFNCNVIN